MTPGVAEINCLYCPGCSTACTDKWNFSRIHDINAIWTSKKILQVKMDNSKSDFSGLDPKGLRYTILNISFS